MTHRSDERERFGYYLRYGILLSDDYCERKFNSRHAKDGRFDFAPGKGTLLPRANRSDTAGMAARVQREMAAAGPSYRGPVRNSVPQQMRPPVRPAVQKNHDALSAKYESGNNGDPGAISSGLNDPGGVSYGKHQYSSKAGSAARFVASPEASKWVKDFQGLSPGSPLFNAKWRQIAAQDRSAFAAAQDAFSGRTYYQTAVNAVTRSTGLNLDQGGEAVKQATYSVAVQHGGAAAILRDAVRTADQRMKRTDPAYEAMLINAIYDQRIDYVTRLRNRAMANNRIQDARGFDSILKNRYPRERADALQLLKIP